MQAIKIIFSRLLLTKLILLLSCIPPHAVLAESEVSGFLVSPSARVEKWMAAGEFIELKGQSIYYQTIGSGPALLLIHGYPYSSYDFHRIAETLSANYKIVLIDLPGMGFSDKNRIRYSFEEYADVVNDLLVHLGIKSVDVLGHDLGASVLQELIARGNTNPVTLRTAAFMNSGLFSDAYRPRLVQRLMSQSPDWFGAFISAWLTRGMVEESVVSLFGPDTGPSQELLDDWWSILNYKEGKSVSHRLGRLVFDKVSYQDRWISAMQKTSVPMIYLCGSADPNSGLHMAERYAQLVPNPAVKLFENIGHWPQIEAEDGVVKNYLAFLSANK